MARIELSKITPRRVQEVFQQLPEPTRKSLGRFGTPTDWSRNIRSFFANTSLLPAGFHQLDASTQLILAIRHVAADAALPVHPLETPPDQAMQRFGQVLGTQSIEMSHSESIESIIRDTDQVKSGEGHFLHREPLG